MNPRIHDLATTMLNRLKVHGGILKDAAKKLTKGAESTDAKILDATSHDETVPEEQHFIDVIGDLAALHLNDVEANEQVPRMPRYIEQIVKRIHTRDWRTVVKSLLLVHSCYRIGGPALLDELSKHNAKFCVPQKDFADTDVVRRTVTLSHHYGRYLAVRALAYQSGVRHEHLAAPDAERALSIWRDIAKSPTGIVPSGSDVLARAPLRALNTITAQLLALAACEFPWSSQRPPLVAELTTRLADDAEKLLAISVALAAGLVDYAASVGGNPVERTATGAIPSATAAAPASIVAVPATAEAAEGAAPDADAAPAEPSAPPTDAPAAVAEEALPYGTIAAASALVTVIDEITRWRRVSGEVDAKLPDDATRVREFVAARNAAISSAPPVPHSAAADCDDISGSCGVAHAALAAAVGSDEALSELAAALLMGGPGGPAAGPAKGTGEGKSLLAGDHDDDHDTF